MTFPEEGVITNIGDDFDPVTGLYTAPVNGTYVFVFNMYKDFTITSFITCDILRNGQAVGNAFVPPTTDGYLEASAATVLYLKKDETVSLGRCQNIDGVYDLTSFMGFLLRAD